MAEQRKNRWTWEVPGFEPRKSVERDEQRSPRPLSRRNSISGTSQVRSAELPRSRSVAAKLRKLTDQVKQAHEDYLELRQEAIDIKEYSYAKIDRVTRYLGFVADRAHKLDQAALESKARISPLISEKRRLFDELLTAKGNVKVFCRARPLFEDEGESVVEFPDDFSIRLNLGDDSATKDFEFDRVYGPHVGQGDLFHDIQPFVQSSLDGFNVSIFAYGPTRAGKTYTMEGSSQDRGVYVRSFEELFDLSNADTFFLSGSNADSTSVSKYEFFVTVFELYNDQVKDLLLESNIQSSKISMGPSDSAIELVQEKVENPLDFCQVIKTSLENRAKDVSRQTLSHVVVTIHIHYSNNITSESLYSKLTLVDLAGSESLLVKDATEEIVEGILHVSNSLSVLGDVLSSLTSKKEIVPYENSKLTNILSDSLGVNSKALMIVNICPSSSNLTNILSCLNFSARAKNADLSLGNRDTIKKWRDVASASRKELYEKEKEANDLRKEMLGLRIALKDANDQCILLFNEVQKAWKVSFTLQADLKSENSVLVDQHRMEKEQNGQLRNQVADLMQLEQDLKMQLKERDLMIQSFQEKVKNMGARLSQGLHSSDAKLAVGSNPGSPANATGLIQKSVDNSGDESLVIKKLEEELLKRDKLIERLHEENEKLFDRLTEKLSLGGAAQVSRPSFEKPNNLLTPKMGRHDTSKGQSFDVTSLPSPQVKSETIGALVKSDTDRKTTPAGEYLTSALMDFDPEQFESFAAVADGANKLLMLVLAAVIKAGAAREHEILAEIRDAVFSFIRKMEARRVMDAMLVSRVRILYIRSLIARSPELQSIKVSPVERFLEKPNSGRSRSSSRSNSPGHYPVYHESTVTNAFVDERIQGFKVNIRQEKKSKISSIVLKLRGIDQEMWKQQIMGGKLREITEEAKSFAIGNKALAGLFVHTPAGELQRQIRSWLAENFDFLSVTGGDAVASGQLELLSTAIMDGWMAGLGASQHPTTDALGQLLSEYTKRVYTSQLQHLKDIAGTLATEDAGDSTHVSKLRSALESVDHKRRKILQKMRNDIALLSKEEGGSPIQNPSTAAEDARLASLISLDGILKQVKDITRQTSTSSMTKSKKDSLLGCLTELSERRLTLLAVDHPCAQREIAEACRVVESIPVQENNLQEVARASQQTADLTAGGNTEVTQWNVLQFNTGSTAPFIIKCGANSNSELVIKADARVQEPKGGEVVRVAPRPAALSDMNLEELKIVFTKLPEALSSLALARTADGTRARYSRLYKTLAMKVPALRDLVGELEKGGMLKDARS